MTFVPIDTYPLYSKTRCMDEMRSQQAIERKKPKMNKNEQISFTSFLQEERRKIFTAAYGLIACFTHFKA